MDKRGASKKMFKFNKSETNNSYEKTKKYVLNVVLIFLLGILSFRFFLPYCAPTKHKIENMTFSSVKKLEGNDFEAFLQRAEFIFEKSKENPFYDSSKKIVFCFHSNKKFYSFLSFGKSLGFAMSFGKFNVIHFSETDFVNNTVTGRAKKYNVRKLDDSAVHELTHVYLSKGLSVIDFLFIPGWKNEGIAECIASSSSYDIKNGLENFYEDVNDKSKQYEYFKYRLAVSYLTKKKNLSYDDVLKFKHLKFKDILEEIKQYDKDVVLSWLE